MDEDENQNLDTEYKRYLEILRPYLGQLLEQDVIEICNTWIQRLSSCKENEKALRNKYIFMLCYQLAKGILEDPFLKNPPLDELSPLPEGMNSDESTVNDSTEVEYLVLDLDNANTKVLFNNQQASPPAKSSSHNSVFQHDQYTDELADPNKSKTSANFDINQKSESDDKQSLICYHCPKIIPETAKNNSFSSDNFEQRAKNLVIKLRETKNRNLILHNELKTLREEPILKYVSDESRDCILTSATNVSFSLLKLKLKELQESRNILIETISDLQDKLDHFNEIKTHEFEDIQAQHKLEIIEVKTSIREETRAYFDQNVKELKLENEKVIHDIQSEYLKELANLRTNRENIISERDKVIQSKEDEISHLKNYIEDLKSNQYSMFSKFLERPQNDFDTKFIKDKEEEFERRLNKMEKSKIKYSKMYETKLADLQKEKHLNECSLQLQLVKLRAQVINETVDDHQTELASALDKLECKYKDIVANVQATAVQRRIQDQMALESIIQTVCGYRNEGLHSNKAQATHNQLSNAMRNQTRDINQPCEDELPTLFRDNKVGSVIVGNKSFGNESLVNGYCLDGEKFGELFERVCIPQRDTGGGSPKK